MDECKLSVELIKKKHLGQEKQKQKTKKQQTQQQQSRAELTSIQTSIILQNK
jgi:hypothetical protein